MKECPVCRARKEWKAKFDKKLPYYNQWQCFIGGLKNCGIKTKIDYQTYVEWREDMPIAKVSISKRWVIAFRKHLKENPESTPRQFNELEHENKKNK